MFKCFEHVAIHKYEKLICVFSDKLGKLFAPVGYDMQGNINVSKYYRIIINRYLNCWKIEYIYICVLLYTYNYI